MGNNNQTFKPTVFSGSALHNLERSERALIDSYTRLGGDIVQHDLHARILLADLVGKDISGLIAKTFVDTRFRQIYKEEKEQDDERKRVEDAKLDARMLEVWMANNND